MTKNGQKILKLVHTFKELLKQSMKISNHFDNYLFEDHLSAISAIVRNFIIFTQFTSIYQYFFYMLLETFERIFLKHFCTNSKFCSS